VRGAAPVLLFLECCHALDHVDLTTLSLGWALIVDRLPGAMRPLPISCAPCFVGEVSVTEEVHFASCPDSRRSMHAHLATWLHECLRVQTPEARW
jgi:hypothetical protein